jgi:uncharacterized membrane protein
VLGAGCTKKCVVVGVVGMVVVVVVVVVVGVVVGVVVVVVVVVLARIGYDQRLQGWARSVAMQDFQLRPSAFRTVNEVSRRDGHC